jgi:hypothetical protein
MYGALQVKREALGRLGVPIVLWLKPEELRELATRAADFFAHRGGLYNFCAFRHEGQPARALPHHKRAAQTNPAR